MSFHLVGGEIHHADISHEKNEIELREFITEKKFFTIVEERGANIIDPKPTRKMYTTVQISLITILEIIEAR